MAGVASRSLETELGSGTENELGRRNKINECIQEMSDSDQDPELC